MDVGEGQKQSRCIDSHVRRRGGVCVSNEATRLGSLFCIIIMEIHPSSAHRTGPFRPTIALQMARVGVPASPWMWAKARSKLEALIRLCGDGVVSNEARIDRVILHGNYSPLMHTHTHRHTEPDRSDPPPHSIWPELVFPPRHRCGRRPAAN